MFSYTIAFSELPFNISAMIKGLAWLFLFIYVMQFIICILNFFTWILIFTPTFWIRIQLISRIRNTGF